MFLSSLSSVIAHLLTDDEYAAAVLLSRSNVVRFVVAVLCIYLIRRFFNGPPPANSNRLPTFEDVQHERLHVQNDILYDIQERYDRYHVKESYPNGWDGEDLATEDHSVDCKECAMEYRERTRNRISILREVECRLQQIHSGEPLYPWRKHEHEDEVQRVEAEVRREWQAYLEIVKKIS